MTCYLIMYNSQKSSSRVFSNNAHISDEDSRATAARVGRPISFFDAILGITSSLAGMGHGS